MIYCSNNNTNGRLGNQVMRIMGMLGIATKCNTTMQVPEWKYAGYFSNVIPQGTLTPDCKVKEHAYHYTPEFWEKQDWQQVIDINGYLQSYKYWTDPLQFTPAYIDKIKNKYRLKDNALAISIRRGDFIGNSNYYQLGITYYLTALLKHFPDWQQRNIYIFSDDLDYCRVHFECLDNVEYIQGSDIEQLCAMTLCSDFIISNSTFSFVGAWLANRGKVVRPVRNMAGALAVRNSEKDYWPEAWIKHDNEKLNLRDTTFTIPVYYDHTDRRHNLSLNVCMLQRDFDTNIIVGEQHKKEFANMAKYCRYMHFELAKFHRTKMLNDMAIAAETPIVYNWDADVFVPPLQVYLAVQSIRRGKDFVYPYDGRFGRVPRHPWFIKMQEALDTGIFAKETFKGLHGAPNSVGGAVAVSKDAFADAGMENEHMLSYAPEDCERWDRWHKLGYKIERIKGCLYHMDHFIGINSSSRNPHFSSNHAELDKIRQMDAAALRAYVASWSWASNYTEKYYASISPGAIESAKHVYAALEKINIKPQRIIDIGCGIGEWHYKDYSGVDMRVLKKALLFPADKYYDYDLRSGDAFPVQEKFDLCLCLEVLEHVAEEYAEQCIGLLCSLSDTVLFSAAIPYQGGKDHVNEQFQSWWSALFAKHGFGAARKQPAIRDNNEVECWYRQNIVLYVRGGKGVVEDYIDKQMWMNVAATVKV